MRGSGTPCPVKALTRPPRPPWVEDPARSPNPGKCANEESYGKIQENVGKGRHGICGIPWGVARRHDGGPPVEGDLRQEPGVAGRGGTCWWDVSWQWLQPRNHSPLRHFLRKDGMELSPPQSGGPSGTVSIPSREKSPVYYWEHMALPRES